MRDWIHLIASATYPFPEVMRALAEPMCVFPVEGLPGQRYFPGSAVMDGIERRAEELLCEIFAPSESYRATIQPHSGTQANQIIYNAVLSPDDVVFSLRASDGGHVSHKVLGGRPNVVKFFPITESGTVDYDMLDSLAMRERPRLIIAGGSACPREIDFEKIAVIARRSGALLHADVSHTATFIAAGVHAAVTPGADFITFNMCKNMRGPNGGVLIYRSNFHKEIARSIFPGTQGAPNENTMFAKLVTLEKLSTIDLTKYAKRMVSLAQIMADVFYERGLSVLTGGTDSHLLVIDLRPNHLTGAEAERLLEEGRVLANRNLVPRDTQKPWITSGLRLGTSCITVLGYSDTDAARLSHWIASRLTKHPLNDSELLIDALTSKYNHALIPAGIQTMTTT